MTHQDIILIGLMAGVTIFFLLMASTIVAALFREEDNVNIPETFQLPQKLTEIDEEERRYWHEMEEEEKRRCADRDNAKNDFQ